MIINSKIIRTLPMIFTTLLISTNIQAGNENITTDTKTGEQFVMKFGGISIGSGGSIIFTGKGKTLLSKSIFLTSGDIVSIKNNSVQIANGSFQITKDTKICSKTGKKTKLNAFKVGDGITITSLRKGKMALTLKMGLASYTPNTSSGAALDQKSYKCK